MLARCIKYQKRASFTNNTLFINYSILSVFNIGPLLIISPKILSFFFFNFFKRFFREDFLPDALDNP